MKTLYTCGRGAVLAVLALTVLAGCPKPASPGKVHVPEPLNLLLPKRVRIHPFSDVTRAPKGALRIEVRIEAVDAFGDATKMFGKFRFEVYALKPRSLDERARLLETWDVSVMGGQENILHWDGITRTYVFKLDWSHPPGRGQPFVMRAIFSSPFTQRFIAERTFG